MGHATGELADGLHLLALTELSLQALVFTDVAQHQAQPVRFAVLSEHHAAAEQHRHGLAVFALQGELDPARFAAFANPLEGERREVLTAGAQQLQQRATEERLARGPDRARQRPVAAQDAVVVRRARAEVRRRLVVGLALLAPQVLGPPARPVGGVQLLGEHVHGRDRGVELVAGGRIVGARPVVARSDPQDELLCRTQPRVQRGRHVGSSANVASQRSPSSIPAGPTTLVG